MALTWQNVSPSNPAGILQAGNMAAANIAKGLDTVGSSMQEGAEDYKDAETGKLLLMLDNAKDRNERQTILDDADKSYIDQDVIAKDNQQFEIGEERKAETLFNRGMQTDAAARDILAKKTTADFQQFQREDTAEKTKLQAENRAADVLTRDAQNERMYQTRVNAEKNKEAERTRLAEISKIKESRALNLDTQQRQINEIRLKELETEQANVTAGKGLIGSHQQRLTEASASIPALTAYWTELDTKEIGGVKAAKALKEQVATQLYRQINRFDVFGDGVKISDKLRSVTGGTIQENRANHKANVKVFSDSLRNTLPGVINEKQLVSMSERMLNNVQMTEENTYGDAALNLNKSIDSVRKDKANEFSRMLFDYRESDDGISADEYAKLDRYIKNPGTFNVDTASIRGDLRSMLEIEVARQFDNTQLVDPNNISHVDTLRKGAAIGGGLFNKNKIKTNHKELVTRLTIAEMARAKSFGVNEKEVRAQIKEQLSNIPGYETVLANADISFEQQKKNEDAENNLLGSRMASSANSSEQVNKAIKYHMDNRLSVPESLMNKQKKLVKDNAAVIIEENNLGIDGKFDIEIVEGKRVFNYDKYNAWNIGVRDAIKKAYPGVTDTTLDSEIGNIVAKDPFLKKSLDMHNRTVNLLQELAKTKDAVTVMRGKTELTKKLDFEENPKLYLYEHIASSGAIGDILGNLKSKGNESENIDNYNQTARNIQEVANKIYDVLHKEHNVGKDGGIDTNELRKKAEAAFTGLEIDTQWFYGNEASFNKLSKEEIIRAAAGPTATGGGSKSPNALDTAAIKRLEERLARDNLLPHIRKQLEQQLDNLKG